MSSANITALLAHVRRLCDIHGSSIRSAGRKSADIWQTWGRFTQDVEKYAQSLSPARICGLCLKRSDNFMQSLDLLAKSQPHADAPAATYRVDLDALRSKFGEFRDSMRDAFSTNDEQQLISSAKFLLKPCKTFLDSLTKDYIGLFSVACLLQNEASGLQKNCIHEIEVILEALRSLGDIAPWRSKLSIEVLCAESEISLIYPPPNEVPAFTLVRQETTKPKARPKPRLSMDGSQLQAAPPLLPDSDLSREIPALKATYEALRAERDAIFDEVQQSSNRLQQLRDQECRSVPYNPREDIRHLQKENQRLKTELSRLREERSRVSEEFINAKAFNIVNARNSRHEAEYAENAKLRQDKVGLLAEQERLREDILAYKSFRSKAAQLSILPLQDDYTKQQLIKEFEDACAKCKCAAENRSNSITTLERLTQQRDELLLDHAVAEWEAQAAPGGVLEKSRLEVLESVVTEYSVERKTHVKEESRQRTDQMLVRQAETNSQIAELREKVADANRAARGLATIAQKSGKAQENADEAQEEIEIMNAELSDNMAANRAMLKTIDSIELDIVRAKAKTATVRHQVEIYLAKLADAKVDVGNAFNDRMAEAGEENRKLEEKVEEARKMVKELAGKLGLSRTDHFGELCLAMEKRLADVIARTGGGLAAARREISRPVKA